MTTSYHEVKFRPERKPRRGAWLKCVTCSTDFYVFPERLRRPAKVRFCSKKCYTRVGTDNPFYNKKHTKITREKWALNPDRSQFSSGEQNPNFIRFGKTSGFFGTTFIWWRTHLLEKIGKCEVCGFSDKRILEVHHKNRDRGDNTRNNLILVCPNCHSIDHWESKSGKYKWRK
jgi:5-methylcytosine-specific restriction endonuclease McrA